MKIRVIVAAAVLSVAMVAVVEAKNYKMISRVAQFDKQLKKKPHTVVWFYNSKSMTRHAYRDLSKIYDKVANVERYKDKEHLQFLAVNTASKEGKRIFLRYNMLSDETMVKLPVFLLFRDGTMIQNQLSGVVDKKRIKSFVERYFKRVPKAKTAKKPMLPMMQKSK